MNVLIWVQHLLGSGHLRRALSVAEALAAAGFAPTLASGGPPMPWRAAGVDIVQLPSLRAADERIAGLVDAQGREPTPALWVERTAILAGLVRRLRPRVVITEMFPFGRRALRQEVLDLLDAAGGLRPRPLVVSSVRDVLVAKTRADRLEEMRDLALRRFDLVLVHGDPALFPFARTFVHADAIADRLVHTGFVLNRLPVPAAEGQGAVLVSAGGGAVGGGLIEAALAARPLSRLAHRRWHLVAGANMPAAHWQALNAGLPAGVTLERHSHDLPGLMAAAEVSVSQAGYNTAAEGLAGAARMVLVPFDAPGQDEQAARAARLRELGLAELVTAAEVTPTGLAAAIDRAAARPRPAAAGLRFDGAQRSAEAIAERLGRHVG